MICVFYGAVLLARGGPLGSCSDWLGDFVREWCATFGANRGRPHGIAATPTFGITRQPDNESLTEHERGD